METLIAYRKQAHHRLKWFLIASTIGAIVALTFEALKIGYPSWKAGLLVGGFIFFPWFIRNAFSDDLVSTKEAVKAFKKIQKQTR